MFGETVKSSSKETTKSASGRQLFENNLRFVSSKEYNLSTSHRKHFKKRGQNDGLYHPCLSLRFSVISGYLVYNNAVKAKICCITIFLQNLIRIVWNCATAEQSRE